MGEREKKDIKKVSWDIVYQEKHEEMRRYRDYELHIASWVITILLAILGASTTNYFEASLQKIIITLIALMFTIAGVFSVLYASAKFEAHKIILFEELKLEPKEYRESWNKKKKEKDKFVRKVGRPRNLIIFVLISLFIAIVVFLWLL